MVLFDPGVSRRHARICETVGAWRAEDCGSANGTRVNGQLLQRPCALQTGDLIAVGPVVFAFQVEAPLEQVAGQETRIVNRATVMPDRSVTAEELSAQPLKATAALPAVRRPLPQDVAELETVDKQLPARKPPSGPARAVAKAEAKKPLAPQLSAAERARLKRQAGDSLGGQLKYQWSQLSPKARLISGGLSFVLLAGILGTLGWLVWPQNRGGGPTGPEPEILGVKPIEQSFGLGPGVTWRRPDMKVFDFEFTTPPRGVVVLHFMAQDITENEVSIIVNGVEQGSVPADVAGMELELEQVLAPSALKRNEKNQLIFDNVRNPPGADPWRVSNLWMEVVPIPELTPEDTLRTAQDYAKQARQFQEQREVGSENLFRAWKAWRFAWLAMESMDERPELYEMARYQMSTLKRELDQLCAKLMLEAERSIQLRQRVRARQTLESVPQHFPTNEHRCHNLARKKLYDYNL